MIDLPTIDGGWRCVLADVPWAFKTFGKSEGRPLHYDRMTLADIKEMPVFDVAAPDCHLFMWTTGPHMPQAIDVMRTWGFDYSGFAFTWVKLRRGLHPTDFLENDVEDLLHVGMGYTTRKNAEFVLLGRRGHPKRQSASVREVIVAPRREHSRKPDEVYQRIETYCVGPRLELFGRQSRPGWTVWGDEATKFDAPSSCTSLSTTPLDNHFHACESVWIPAVSGSYTETE